ncbi:hypothetical protein D3C78_405890 [compost metagenome]
MGFQAHVAAAGLDGVFDQVQQAADQGVAVAQQLADTRIALPAHLQAIHVRLGSGAQAGEQLRRGQAIRQRQLATGEYQHVPHLVFQFVQALLEPPGEALLLFRRQLLLIEVAGVEHGGGQRRADLMGQRGDHPPQRGQAFMAGQLILQAAGFGEVVEQHQLAGLAIQRTGGDGQTTPIAQGNLVAVVFTRSEAAGDHLTPEHAHQRLAEQPARRRIGLAHHALAVDHDDAAGQQVEQALQTIGQALLFRQLLHALGADQGQLTLQLGDARLQQAIGLAELAGHLVEQGESLFKTSAAAFLHRIRCRGGTVGGLHHATLSSIRRQRNVGRRRHSKPRAGNFLEVCGGYPA